MPSSMRSIKTSYTSGSPLPGARSSTNASPSRGVATASDLGRSRRVLRCTSRRDYARALRYLQQAADNAARRFANREAIAYLTRALERVERLPETKRDDARLALLEQRGLVRRAMGYDVQGAVQDFSLLAGLARDQGRLEYQVRALVYLSIVLSWADLERCLATAEQAMDLSRHLDDDLLRSHARGVYGHWHSLFRHWRAEDIKACAEALEAARQAGDRALMTLHSGQYACFQFLRSEYRAACAAAEQGCSSPSRPAMPSSTC